MTGGGSAAETGGYFPPVKIAGKLIAAIQKPFSTATETEGFCPLGGRRPPPKTFVISLNVYSAETM